jgi:hypothetical protein
VDERIRDLAGGHDGGDVVVVLAHLEEGPRAC